MGKILYFNHEARHLLAAGVDELANTAARSSPRRRASPSST